MQKYIIIHYLKRSRMAQIAASCRAFNIIYTTLVEVDFGKKQKTCHIMQLKRSSLRVVLTSPLLLLNFVTPLQ